MSGTSTAQLQCKPVPVLWAAADIVPVVPTVPAKTLTDENGNYQLDENGNYLTDGE